MRQTGHVLHREVPIERLGEFVTERGNPRNRKHVTSAEIEVPAPFLRRGVRFIDTPGITSIHEHNTATTLAFLPQVDAALFVTGADGPLSEYERAFLDAVRARVRKFFFVLNKIDQIPPPERDEAIGFARRVLADHLGTEDVRIFPILSWTVLQARLNGDTAPLSASSLLAFDETLAGFLTEEHSQMLLIALHDRALKLLGKIRFMAALRTRKQATDTDPALVEELGRQLDRLEAERRQVTDRLRERIRTAATGAGRDRSHRGACRSAGATATRRRAAATRRGE